MLPGRSNLPLAGYWRIAAAPMRCEGRAVRRCNFPSITPGRCGAIGPTVAWVDARTKSPDQWLLSTLELEVEIGHRRCEPCRNPRLNTIVRQERCGTAITSPHP